MEFTSAVGISRKQSRRIRRRFAGVDRDGQATDVHTCVIGNLDGNSKPNGALEPKDIGLTFIDCDSRKDLRVKIQPKDGGHQLTVQNGDNQLGKTVHKFNFPELRELDSSVAEVGGLEEVSVRAREESGQLKALEVQLGSQARYEMVDGRLVMFHRGGVKDAVGDFPIPEKLLARAGKRSQILTSLQDERAKELRQRAFQNGRMGTLELGRLLGSDWKQKLATDSAMHLEYSKGNLHQRIYFDLEREVQRVHTFWVSDNERIFHELEIDKHGQVSLYDPKGH